MLNLNDTNAKILERFHTIEQELYLTYKITDDLVKKWTILEMLRLKTQERKEFEKDNNITSANDEFYEKLLAEIQQNNDAELEKLVQKSMFEQRLQEELALQRREAEENAIKERAVAQLARNLESQHAAQSDRRDYYKRVRHWNRHGEEVDQTKDYISKTRFTM